MLLAGAALVAGFSTWLSAVDHRAEVPPLPTPAVDAVAPLVLTGAHAGTQRLELLERAAVHLGARDVPWKTTVEADRPGEPSSCHFVESPRSGTTPKFDCLLANGEVVKVKYGRHPEIHAEVAAARLLQLLGYPADTVTMVPRLRCYGCPRFPFLGARVRVNPLTRNLPIETEGYTDFEWVSVERRFPARPIETEHVKGWDWWELDRVSAAYRADRDRSADLDALKLLAVFLAHWDNKSENQRLVCLDAGAGDTCEHPLAMIQDLGATFGPMKANLARWRDLPVWHDRDTCAVTMRTLPYRGATFPDAVISEAGRARLAARLTTLAPDDVRRLFEYARFPQYQSSTGDEKDLHAWTAAFRDRVNQIQQARCPA
jgi:hypothetical protein